MQKLMLALFVGLIALAPAFAAAQTSPGSSGSGSTSPSGTTGSGSSGSPSGGTMSTPSPSGSSGSSSSPSASPSGSGAADFAKYTNRADCEKAGGMWQTATNACVKK
jgi:hypothetical protein